jgi:hypothetical protein
MQKPDDGEEVQRVGGQEDDSAGDGEGVCMKQREDDIADFVPGDDLHSQRAVGTCG